MWLCSGITNPLLNPQYNPRQSPESQCSASNGEPIKCLMGHQVRSRFADGDGFVVHVREARGQPAGLSR